MSEDGYQPLDRNYPTRAIHEAQSPEQWKSRAVVPPVTLTSTYKVKDVEFPDFFVAKNFHYGRLSNPNRLILEQCIASLDNAKYACCFSSGMAATANLLQVLKSGDHVIGAKDVYGGTYHYLMTIAIEQGLETSFFDPLNLETLEQAIKANTKMVWVESLSNPSVNVVDIRRVAAICKEKSEDIILVVDNTYLSSYFQKPLELGAHVVMHSLTKYMNGHSDVIMGALVTSDDAIHKRLRFLQNYVGAVPSPFDCYLVNRGLKTMAVRMREHMKNSIQVAKFLQTNPLIENVLHPGLEEHPQHALFKSQCSGHSGMMAFCIKDATLEHVEKFLRALKYIHFAGSLGGVESLIASPPLMSHTVLPPEERLKVGITDNLVRLSVGLEDPDDLCKDLDQALKVAMS